jgi:hypothetical protein
VRTPSHEPPDENAGEAPPPVLGSWRNVYAFVLVELGVIVALFYALTRWVS